MPFSAPEGTDLTKNTRTASWRRLWSALGPGLTTGAADDDPSGIATYSQAGAQFGYALTWTVLLTLPFMAAIQIISAWLGWRTGNGLARNIADRLSPLVLYFLVALLAIANTINIAADLAAMGEALRLVIGGPALAYALTFGVACLPCSLPSLRQLPEALDLRFACLCRGGLYGATADGIEHDDLAVLCHRP